MEKQQGNKVVLKRAEVLLSLNHLWTDRGKRNRGDLIQRRQGPRSPRLPADQAKSQPSTPVPLLAAKTAVPTKQFTSY